MITKTLLIIELCICTAIPILAQEKTDFDYQKFESYFNVIDKESMDNMTEDKLIPRNLFTNKLFQYETDSIEKIWGRTKILYSNGYHLFIYTQLLDYSLGDIDNTEDNIINDLYSVFYNETLLERNNGELSNVLDISMSRDGEEYEQTYTIDSDSTILIDIFQSSCCLSTGFDTPIDMSAKVRLGINNIGKLEPIEVLKLEFSSLLFEKCNLNELLDDSYPTEENKYELYLQNFIEEIPFFQNHLMLFFYIKMVDGAYYPIFESRTQDGEILDTLIVDKSSFAVQKSVQHSKSGMINCPILIKLSDSTFQLLPNGKFLR